jgi:porin
MVEGAYSYNQGAGRLPGTLKLGTWRLFGTFEQGATGSAGLPIGLQPVPGQVTDHDYAFYAILDQMLYRLPGEGDPKGIAAFGRVIGAPDYGNMIGLYLEAGLTFSGMTPSRPNDVFGIGFAYTGVSSQIINFEKEAGDPVASSYEGMLEASYTAQIVPGFILQPDFQYFWNPGGHAADPYNAAKAVPDAAVLGLRTTINY